MSIRLAVLLVVLGVLAPGAMVVNGRALGRALRSAPAPTSVHDPAGPALAPVRLGSGPVRGTGVASPGTYAPTADAPREGARGSR